MAEQSFLGHLYHQSFFYSIWAGIYFRRPICDIIAVNKVYSCLQI
jgi:hypothetical protein